MTGQLKTDTSNTYIHNKPISFKANFLQTLMSIIGIKNKLEKQMIKGKFAHESAPIPKSLQHNFDVEITEINARKTWTIKPKQYVSEKVILFIHGGAYINNLLKFHWYFIEKLLHKTNATIIIPDYPLAPKSDANDTYTYIETIYNDLLVDVTSDDLIFIGDSAGGGFALGFAQKLRNENKKQPSQLILISPWLDITMRNPEISKVDKKDKMLGIKGLQLAGKSYAGDIDPSDFKVSPIYGDLSGLNKISLFIGTHDVLLADARKLKQLMDQEHIPISYFEYPKMFHDWIILTGLKESKHALAQISLLIKKS